MILCSILLHLAFTILRQKRKCNLFFEKIEGFFRLFFPLRGDPATFSSFCRPSFICPRQLCIFAALSVFNKTFSPFGVLHKFRYQYCKQCRLADYPKFVYTVSRCADTRCICVVLCGILFVFSGFVVIGFVLGNSRRNF